MPVLARRRDEIGEPVQEHERRELDDAIGSWPRGFSAAAGPDPVGGPNGDPASGQRVADSGCAAAWAADHGKSLKREGGPGAIPQQVLQTLKIARHVAVDKCDPDARIDRKPAVLLGEHLGGGRGVEQARKPEPPDCAATDPLGEGGQIGRGDRPGRQERRRGVAPCIGSSRSEDTVGHLRPGGAHGG